MSSQQESMAASQRSGASASHHGIRRSADVRHFFPLLQCLESNWPSSIVFAGFLIEIVQIAALIINHRFPWGGIIEGASVPIYFSILPFWDQQYPANTDFTYGSILFWVLMFALLLLVGMSLRLVRLIADQADRTGQDTIKLILHSITGVFFLPGLHILLAYSVCDQNANYVLAFPEKGCFGEPYTTLLFAAAVLGMAILVALRVVSVIFLYDDHPGSLHYKARPHNIGEVAMIALHLLLVTLYHFMPAMGMRQAFAGIFAFTCFVVGLIFTVILPFYRQFMNTIRVVSLFVLAYIGMVACVLLEDQQLPAAQSQHNWNSLILLAGGFIVALLSYFVANFRISRQSLIDLNAAMRGEHSASRDKALFPANLPVEERIKFRDHEAIALGEARFTRTQESLTGPQQEREELRDELWVCSPYLDAVHCATDVEVATRHVHVWQQITGLRAPSPMVAMGIRIFSKGLAKYPDNPWLELQFASYMCTLAPQRNQVSLSICERILRNDGVVDTALCYRATRRSASISAAMFIRDNTHKKGFVNAQQMHKEALVNMKLFWGKLLADQVDIVQLGALAKVITDRREEGLKCYERVVSESTDTNSLIRYAQFLEQVLMDNEAATHTREAVLDSMEQEQLGGVPSGGPSGGGGSGRPSDKPTGQQPQGANAIATAVMSTRQRTTSISRSRTISSLNRNVNLIFAILFAVMGGLLVFGIVVYIQRAKTADKIQSAGMCRGLSQEMLLYVDLIAYETSQDAPSADLLSQTVASLQEQLTNFRTEHIALTYGKYKTSFQDVVDVFALSRADALFPTEGTTAADLSLMGLWELGLVLVSALETIISDLSTDHARSYAITTVRSNALNGVGRLYNASLEAYTSEATQQLHAGEYAMIALYILSVAILFVVYFVLILNFRKISSSKLSTLSLFTLIPKNALEKLMFEGKARIDHFDQPDEVFESLKRQRGLEDDEDGLHEQGEENSQSGKDLEPLLMGKDGTSNGIPGTSAAVNVSSAAAAADQDRGGDDNDLDLHGKFATLLKNSTVGDTGKMKLVHHGQYETPYTKDQWIATPETPEEIKERLRLQNELHVDEDLRMLRESGSLDSNSGEGSDGADGDRDGQGKDSKFSTLQNLLSGSIVVMFAMLIVLGGLFIADYSNLKSIQKDRNDRELGLENNYQYFRAVQTLRQLGETFLVSPSTITFTAFTTELLQDKLTDTILAATYRVETTPEYYAHVFEARRNQRVLLDQLFVLMRVVCDASSISCASIQAVTNTWEASLFVAPASLLLMEEDQSVFPAFSPTSLSFMTNAQKIQAAWRVLSSQYYLYLKDRVAVLSGQASAVLESDIASKSKSTADDLQTRAQVEIAIAAALLILVFVTLINSPFHISYGTQLAGLFLLILVAGAAIGIAAPRAKSDSGTFSAQNKMVSTTRLRYFTNTSLSSTELLRDLSLRVIYNADPLAAMNIEAQGGPQTVEVAWERIGESIDPSQYGALSDAFDTLRLVIRQDLIASALGCSSASIYAPPVLGLWWNFTSEPYGPRYARYFPTQVFYTDRTNDLSLSAAAQLALAKNILVGPMQTTFMTLSTTQMIAIIQSVKQTLNDDLEDKLSSAQGLAVGGIIISFVGVAITVLIVVLRLFDLVDSSNMSRIGGGGEGSGGAGAGEAAAGTGSAGGGSGGSGGGGAQRQDELFEKLTKHSQIALCLLAVMLTVLFIFTMVDLTRHESRSHNQNAASMREFYAIRSYAAIQQGLNRTNLNHLALNGARGMLVSSEDLYFGTHTGATKGALGESSSLTLALFGPKDAPNEDRFNCDTASDSLSIASNHTILSALSLGVDPALRRWYDVIHTINVLPSATDRMERIYSLETPFRAMLVAMRASTSDYTDATKTAAQTGLIGFMVILGVTLFCAFLLFLFVFKPMIGQLLNEEEGTKVMLKMIPAEVRESVPAIAEYLETGVVMQDMKVHEINEAAADLSTIPTITIDGRGTIVKFSRAAEDAFLWTKGEAVGANVSMLMPENIAIEHDGYLSRYRKTGVKTIINRLRKIRAKRKDGSLFPAEILVREVRNGRSTLFVGTLRNISVEIEFERAIVLSKAVSEAATVPIVVITHKGVILRFNAAAEEAFKCGQEIVGKKVNNLMPMAEAEAHDSFLDRYLKTGIKTVVDHKRNVRAKKLNGELFPARLNIRELKRSGSDSIFIGYIEDMTKQVHLQMASMVSDAIMATSPVPLIGIDDFGLIISWSPAAQHTFGILPQDAIGKNVKMLMLDNVAARHDSYLQTYQKTGRKKMIGNVTLQKAKRKEEDGTTTIVPVRIAVKDIVQQGKSNYFVAFVQDVSKQQHLETEYKISSSITNLSTLPLVTIDEVGTIQSFSAAAEVCFGFSKQETIGQNVIMLMPESYRGDHDENLRRYFATGVKTVIDIVRKVQGQTKDGRIFPIELMVREVKHEGKYNFVGYIKDISNDFLMAEANAYGDAISQLAVVPVLCIGLDGIIIACSESTCERFLWSREELVGQNISVLMPDSIGTRHAGFLQAYKTRLAAVGVEKARETSSLLHKERQVTGRTRDEQHFQCAVHVRDLHIDGMPPMFVGYLRDITDEVNQTIQKTIADAIVLSSSIPLICINTVGSVTLFSKAAEKDFMYPAHEVMGKNIKMLMPEEVAVKHDGYLRSYVKTGIKSVIDSRRQVIARKRNGTNFSVEITVKEVIQKDATGRDHVEYIGFVRDLTQQFILLQANTINDVVSQLATVPIVIINIRGLILDFNLAASKEFGYTQEEALNKNVKMLMPDDIAAQHDGFLLKYRTSRKKVIIDSTRRLTAKRRSGEHFPCEISVREVIKEGTEGQYIGYIRDVSHEQLLAQQYRVNSAIIDLSTTPIIVIDIKGEISIFSRAAEEVFGYDRKEVEGQNVKMLMPPDVSIHHDGFLANYARTGKKNVIDTARRVRAQRKRGTTFPAEISVREIHSSDGQNIFIGYLLDCTEETVLSAAAAFSECVNALSPVPIVAIDHIGTIVRFSSAAEEEFRVASDVVVGQNIKSLQPNEVAIQHDEYLSRYLKTGIRTIIGSTRVISCKRWDDTYFQAEITVREVKDLSDPKALPNFVGYLRNIESELQIEEAFREGNAMLELAPIPILSITLRGTISDVNPAGESTFGYTKAEMIGQNIKMLMPKHISDQHDMFLDRYLKTRQKTVIDTIRHVVGQRKNGANFHVEIAVREIHVDGMENMYIGYVKDVTGDLKMAEAASLNEAVNSLSSVPLIVIDPVGEILKLSQAAEDLFGYTQTEIIGQNIKTLMPNSIAIKHDRYLEAYRTTRKKTIIDSSRIVQGIRKDGSQFACEIGVREVLHDDGKTTAVFVGYIRNLDEAALQVGQSAEINSMMMDLAVQGVVIIDRYGTVERINDAVLHMLRIPDRSHIIGKNIKLLMPDVIANEHDGYLSRYYETREKHIVDSQKQTTGKEWGTTKLIPLEVAVREIIEKGKEIRYLGYIRRIDKELEIQTAKKTSAAALDLSPYATVVIDAKGTVLMFSRAAEAMFEVAAKDVIGKNVKMLMPPEISVHHDDYLATYRRTGEKHVVDSARVVNGRAVGSGRVFTVQLQIKECTFSIKGLESVFVGYIAYYP